MESDQSPSLFPSPPGVEMPAGAGAEDPVRWPYSRRIYVARLAWLIVWKTLWRVCWHRIPVLRTFILKCFGAKISGRLSVFGTARIEMPWDMTIGENVSIGQRVQVYNLGGVSIGSHTFLSQDVYLCGGTHDHTSLAYPLIRKKITLGNYVWIAAGAFIGPGVTVGDGAVVGARAVVMKDVAPWTIVAGNPAKVVKARKLRHALPASSSPRSANPNRPLRILHLLTCSDAGGLSRYVFDLCTALHAQGHEVAVAGARGPWHWLFEDAPWPWIDVPLSGGLLDLWRGGRALRHYLKTHPVDLIHSHYRRTSLVGRRIRSSHDVPLLYTLHLSDIPLHWPRWLLSDFGDHTHAPSADGRRWLIERAGVPPERISLVPHGVDPNRFTVATEADRLAARAELGLCPDDLVAVYVGRFDDPKNVNWLLDLATMNGGDGPLKETKVKILLVGEGPQEEALCRRIEQEKLKGRVMILGRRDPVKIYHAADALLLPSGREGFSYVTAEAMCAGVPVLRTRTAGVSELIVEGVTGRSVPIDHDAFLRAAAEFLSDRAALVRMGSAAAEHVRQHLTFKRQVQSTIELYRRLIAAKSPAA
jgi:putative colanic acid biosynthesis acetyltransferase WcaF